MENFIYLFFFFFYRTKLFMFKSNIMKDTAEESVVWY